ncbi:extracellular solute-binding protein [Nonomuraea sp. NPDC050328]|uniref:extracellular solute-binding protein n=1 Tax=Nonomuraea sp. NPDC050328 TaxID=3364361 RepID=UPI0037A23F50
MRRPTLAAALFTALLSPLLTLAGGCGAGPEATGPLTLTVAGSGEWLTRWAVPEFERANPGIKVGVRPAPADQAALGAELQAGRGADIIELDGRWLGDLARAGRLKPLAETAGPGADGWTGWAQIPQAVQGLAVFEGRRYGIPRTVDARLLFYNRALLRRAGLPDPWRPASWAELLEAARKLKAAGVPYPLHLPTGETAALDGLLPLLAGTGTELLADRRWAGASRAVKDVLGLYDQVYGERLAERLDAPDLARSRFAAGKSAIHLDTDALWHTVLDPARGTRPLPGREAAVGYALLPAQRPGGGLRGQDHVSLSTGTLRVLNPATRDRAAAWKLLTFLHSAPAVEAELAGRPRPTPRRDVNARVLAADPMLRFAAEQALPLTAFPPPVSLYPRVADALREAVAAVVAGRSPGHAAESYQRTLETLVGGPANVAG